MPKLSLLFVLPALFSCSIVVRLLQAKACRGDQLSFCENNSLIPCEDGFEKQELCNPLVCNAEDGYCGACGDNIRNLEHEECDDGNNQDNDGCDRNCTLPRCGNG